MRDARAFLDTNILIYALDKTSKKQRHAIELIDNPYVISTQVLGEFVTVSLRKRMAPQEEIFTYVDDFAASLHIVPITLETSTQALQLMKRYRFSYYDALIASAALLAKCTVLYTEDLQHRQKIKSLTIVNPFV